MEASVVVFTSSNLGYPRGLAFDSSGNLYAANYNYFTISKFDSTGTFLSTIGSYPTLNAPTGITFDSSGNLYAANYSNNIRKFDSTGTFVSTIGSSGNLSYPAGLAFDSSGNFFAANAGSTISKFDSSGNFLFRFDTKDGAIPYFLAVGGSNNPPAEVPEPGAGAFGIIATGSVLGLVARKRRS